MRSLAITIERPTSITENGESFERRLQRDYQNDANSVSVTGLFAVKIPQQGVEALGKESKVIRSGRVFYIYDVTFHTPGQQVGVSLIAADPLLYERYKPDFLKFVQTIRVH